MRLYLYKEFVIDNMTTKRSVTYERRSLMTVRGYPFMILLFQFGESSSTKTIESPIHETLPTNPKVMTLALIHALWRRETLPLKDPLISRPCGCAQLSASVAWGSISEDRNVQTAGCPAYWELSQE